MPHFSKRSPILPACFFAMATFIRPRIHATAMKKQFILGLIGGLAGILIAIYVIISAVSSEQTLSGVQTALFSSLGLMGAAIANKETRFAGWMLILAAVFITLSVPIAGSLNLLFLYMPAIIILAIAAVLCFMEPEEVMSAEPE
jgi:hypothetical protein